MSLSALSELAFSFASISRCSRVYLARCFVSSSNENPARGSHSSYASHLTRTAATKTMIVAARI
jgi:hypothetical protein